MYFVKLIKLYKTAFGVHFAKCCPQLDKLYFQFVKHNVNFSFQDEDSMGN